MLLDPRSARAQERPNLQARVWTRSPSRSAPGPQALRGRGRVCSQLITEQAEIALTRGAEVNGRCGHNESELQVFWVDRAYTLKMLFVKVIRCGGPEGW